MGEKTLIAWCNYTFNAWLGCVRVSTGCEHCYAEVLVKNRMGRKNLWGPKQTTARQRTSPSYWREPFKWAKEAARAGERRRVFCGSLMDVFEDHPDANATRPELWNLIAGTPELDWLLLTKRPENIVKHLPSHWNKSGWPNVWLGTSCENQKYYDVRYAILSKIPAVVRFISYEPALGPIDFHYPPKIMPLPDWMIYGGESGPGYRPEDKNWARSMHQQCELAHVAFFHKQSAAPRTEQGIELDGRIVREYPTPRKAQAVGKLF